MKSKFNSCYFYFLICFLLETNGILYPAGSILSRLVYVLFVLISAYYALYTNMHYKVSSFIKGLNLLVMLYTIYGLILVISGEKLYVSFGTVYNEIGRFDYLKYNLSLYLPIYPFFVFTKQGLLKESNFKFFFYVLFVVAIISFFNYQSNIRLETDREEVTNNKSYVILGLLPAMVVFIKQPKKILLFATICLYFILMGMKRGAILSCVICLIWFFYAIMTNTSKKNKWPLIIIALLIVVSAIIFVNYLLSSSLLFSDRLNQTLSGESSNRDVIYSWFWNHFIHETDPFKLFFGNGAYGTIKLYGIAAHNDWLEIAISHGILGLLVFLYYWYGIIRTWLRTKGSLAYMALGMAFIICFSRSIFSMSGYTIGAALAVGYFLVADTERQ